MRLSKKIRSEVADYFYGRHNFRFSTYNGFQAMAVFNHTIGQTNCDFIKRITVQIPNHDWRSFNQSAYACMHYNPEWDFFRGRHTRRGMRIPDFGFRMKHYRQGRVRGEYNYDQAVSWGYRQLRNMASLESLEILIPWNDEFFDEFVLNPNCPCSVERRQELGRRDRVRHCVEEHSADAGYWTLLANLKQKTMSEDLTIPLVLVHESSGGIEPNMRPFLRQGRWLAAYASVMGYRFGHTKWENDSTYVVRYDKDEMLSVTPEELGEDELEDHALFEPPYIPA